MVSIICAMSINETIGKNNKMLPIIMAIKKLNKIIWVVERVNLLFINFTSFY